MGRFRRARALFVRHLRFVGPGLVSAVAYVDPGNWATDLQAGAAYGYKLLFIVLVSGLAAVVLQLLAVRLGAVTSTSLAFQTRLLFERLQRRHPRHALPLKLCLWALYALAEVAIISTDLAELLGSAIALNLLFPKLPLFAGVLITAADVLIVLVFFRSDSGRQGMLLFEIVIVSLVMAVFVSFMVLLHLIAPDWREVFLGLVPSKTLVEPGALYVGVGIIGATVMPHALFLGSSLASVDRLNMLPVPPRAKRRNNRLPSLLSSLRRRPARGRGAASPAGEAIELGTVPSRASVALSVASAGSQCAIDQIDPSKGLGMESGMSEHVDKAEADYEGAVRQYEADVRAFDKIAWTDITVAHSTIDTIYSLLGFALTINAAILTVAGAVFYYGDTGASADDADLEGAFQLIKSYVGHAAGIIFALALLCAGQSASITATLAGQVVSEGFIGWRTPPFVRRLVTRLIGVVPAAAVAAAAGSRGLNTMLVASQVVLSIVLPTVILPLVYLASRHDVMLAFGPEVGPAAPAWPAAGDCAVASAEQAGGTDDPSRDAVGRFGADGLGGLGEAHAGGASAAGASVSATPSHPEGMAARPTARPPSPPGAPGAPAPARRSKSYASPRWVSALGYALFAVVVVANVYVIVELARGQT